MLFFLASVVEQLDLALEHIRKGDVHNARFGLMLTDNALELVLHRYAKDRAQDVKASAWRREPYQHQRSLDKALGRNFRDKVSFAKTTGFVSARVGQTLAIMHDYRNEVYHIGLEHEAILPALSRFYFEVACRVMESYQPGFFGWSSSQAMPERAKPYFKGDRFFPGERDDFSKACKSLADACGHDATLTITALADHLAGVIDAQDAYIDVVATGVYDDQKTTRDKAVVGCQTWPLAFSEKGKEFARERGFTGSMAELIEWMASNYTIAFKRDPIPLWRKTAQKVRAESDPHAALQRYDSFMKETAEAREWISEACAACEAEIDSLVDQARGR